jgi:hypothetical protein
VAREWVLLQYDGADVQDYWQVSYAVDSTDATAWASDPQFKTIAYSGAANMVSATTATGLSEAAATSDSALIVLTDSSWATGVWDGGSTNYPKHEVSKILGTTSTGTVVVPVNLDDEFTAWYQIQGFTAAGDAAAVTSAAMTEATSRTTLWGAASSLTAAATVVVAASLF